MMRKKLLRYPGSIDELKESLRSDEANYANEIFGSLKDGSIEWGDLTESERESIVTNRNGEYFIKRSKKFNNECLDDIRNEFIAAGKGGKIIDYPKAFGVDLTEKYTEEDKPKDAFVDYKWADVLIKNRCATKVINNRNKFGDFKISRELANYVIETDQFSYADGFLELFKNDGISLDGELAYKFLEAGKEFVVFLYLDEFKNDGLVLDCEFANKIIELSKKWYSEHNDHSSIIMKYFFDNIDEFISNGYIANKEFANDLYETGKSRMVLEYIDKFDGSLDEPMINKLLDVVKNDRNSRKYFEKANNYLSKSKKEGK